MSVLDLMATIGLNTAPFEAGMAKVGGIAVSAGKIAGAALVGATAAVTAVGAASVKTGAEFDASMSQVAATMGLTTKEMENSVGEVDLAWGHFSGDLREYAQEMGKNTAFSAKESADALNYMALAGYDVQTSMEMLPNVLNLAAAGNFDLARASDMVTDAQTAFGMDIPRTTQMVDEMAKAASTGNTSVEQLGDAFLVVGGLAQELNGGMVQLADGTEVEADGIQELEIALTAMANAGIKGSEAGTHMRNMLLKLSSPTDDGALALHNMGVEVFDTEGKMRSLTDIFGDMSAAMEDMTQEEKITAISAIFNTRDIASAEALLNAVGSDWDAIGAEILDAQGAAQKMAETQLDNLQGDVTLFKSALEGAKIAISDELTPTIREFVQFGTEGISDLTTAFQEDGLAGAFEVLGEKLAEGVNMIIEMLPTIIEAAIGLLSSFAQGLLDNAGVILDAIVQIVGMILQKLLESSQEGQPVILTLISDVVKTLTDSLPQFLKIGVEIVMNLVQGLIENLPELISEAEVLIIDFANAVIEALPELIQAGFELIAALVEGLVSHLPELITTAVELLITLRDSLLDPKNLTLLIEAAVALIQAVADGLIQALPMLIEAAPPVIQGLVNAIVDNLPLLIDVGIELIGALVQAILENLGELVVAAIQIIVALMNGIIEATPDLILLIPDLIMELIAAIMSSLPDIIGAGIEIVMSLVEGMLSMLGSVVEAGLEFVTRFVEIIGKNVKRVIKVGKEIITGFKDGIMEHIHEALDWGKDLIDNFVDGIKSRISRITDAIREIAKKIKALLGFSEPEEGPLSNFHTYAPDMIDLFTQGVKDNEDKLRKQVASSFDFSGAVTTPTAYGQYNTGTNKQITIVLELDRQTLGKAVYQLNDDESRRVGVKLANA